MKKWRMFFAFGMIGLFLPMVCVQASERKKDLPALMSPMPKEYRELPGTFILTDSVNIEGLENIDSDTKENFFAFLQKENIKINEEPKEAAVTIVLRISVDEAPKDTSRKVERKLLQNPEGYIIQTEQRQGKGGLIVIEGNDETGVFYGIQTLKQILAQSDIPNIYIEDYPDFPVRGIVEGFYGKPWLHEERLAQLKFYGEHKLNTYIYAPKDDPYHRAKWREPYPPQEMKRMKELIGAAKENKVDFVFAVSPGIDIAFSGGAGKRDFTALLAKLESLYEMGVRSFAIYYDDIEDKNAIGQARLLNRLQREFVDVKGDVKPLMTVPTEYFSLDMANNTGAVKQYTKNFAGTLDKAVNVMYTGPGVVCPEISETDIAKVSDIYGRKMAVWWNYPVNDYLLNKLALGPIYGLSSKMAAYSGAFLMNPMEHAELSKITLQTGAEYAWNPARYDAEAAWDKAIAAQYGDLADAMKVLAEHSSYMDKEWAKVGRPDAPELRKVMDDFFAKIAAKQDVSGEIEHLSRSFAVMEKASLCLMENLPPELLAAAKPQIELLGKLARYDQTALNMIKAKLDGNVSGYNKLRRQTEKNMKDVDASWARLSEKTAVYYLRQSREIE